MTVLEPAKQIPVRADVDLCVAGGSCTGVFAAVRAARLGLKVAVIERTNMFGGMATSALVNIWHSVHDVYEEKQIIAGLTWEMLERLNARGNLEYHPDDPHTAYTFNPAEMAVELDKLVQENRIVPFLHTQYAGLERDGDRITHIYIQNKDGRGAIRARFFVDATGDGDLCRDFGLTPFTHPNIQPPTPCYLLYGDMTGIKAAEMADDHGEEFGLGKDWGWADVVPGMDGMISMRADRHVLGVRCDRADDLTFAEMDGRRQMDACVQMFRKYGPAGRTIRPVGMNGQLGVRDSVHYETRYKVTGEELLRCKPFEDAVVRGTYRVDMHQPDGSICFRYIDGREETINHRGEWTLNGNWRVREGLTERARGWYEMPFAGMILEDCANLLPAGRMVNSDMQAFGALRVMVNLNQMGEAAGVAAALCLDKNCDVRGLDGKKVRENLIAGGSALD